MFKYTTKFYFNKGLKIKVEKDFLRYYFHLLYRSHIGTLGVTPPMYGSHVSVTLPRIHGDKKVEESKKYAGQTVEFMYTGEIVKGGSWFDNFWMPLECPRADEIKKELNIVETNFMGYHLTLGSTKGFIVDNNPKAKELSQRMNKGEFTVSEFRERMKQL